VDSTFQVRLAEDGSSGIRERDKWCVTRVPLRVTRKAAARLVTGTWKYERGLSWLMHDDLHWLVIPQQV